MPPLTFTLLADGPTDSALIPVLRWVLRERRGIVHTHAEWADLRRLRPPPRLLKDRILAAVDLFPCDLLFVHGDAEKEPPRRRYKEIMRAAEAAGREGVVLPLICVVPVRMQEAWLLFNEAALRKDAGNPNGCVALRLPRLSRVEEIPAPKDMLYRLLREAGELRGRRWKKFNPAKRAALVSIHIADFSPLRVLSAFQRLEEDVASLRELRQRKRDGIRPSGDEAEGEAGVSVVVRCF